MENSVEWIILVRQGYQKRYGSARKWRAVIAAHFEQ
jgi:hypothetical protein